MSEDRYAPSNMDVMAIAGIDGLDRNLRQEIMTLLSESGIHATSEGSVVFAIYVYQKDVGVAVQLLKSNTRLLGKKIIIYNPPFRVNCSPGTLL